MLSWSVSLWQAPSLTAAQAPRGRCPAPTHLCRARRLPRVCRPALLAVWPTLRMEQGARPPPAPATSSFHSRLWQASHREVSCSIRIQVSSLPLLWLGCKIRVLFLGWSLQIHQRVSWTFLSRGGRCTNRGVGSWFRKSRYIAVISISILIPMFM